MGSDSSSSKGSGTNLTNETQFSGGSNSLQNFLPANFQLPVNLGLSSLTEGLTGTPNLGQLYNNVPLLGTAPLNAQQLADIQNFQNAAYQPNGAVSGALSGLQDLGNTGANLSAPNATYQSYMGTPYKPSAATNAEIKEFNDLQAPEILQQAALMGQGTSGGALQALSTGQEQALVPFLQQDQANALAAAQGLSSNQLANAGLQESALNSLGNLGTTQEGLQQNQLQNALTAAGLPQQVAQQQAQNAYNQAQQGWQLAQQTQQTPQQWFQDLISTLQQSNNYQHTTGVGVQNQTGSSSQPKF